MSDSIISCSHSESVGPLGQLSNSRSEAKNQSSSVVKGSLGKFIAAPIKPPKNGTGGEDAPK